MTRGKKPTGDRALTREALRLAAKGREPEMERLVGAVPGMLAEARRRRLAASRDPIRALVPQFTRAIPRLAVATALLVLVSIVLYVSGPTETTTAEASFESLLLGGEDLLDEADPFYEAILGGQDGDG